MRQSEGAPAGRHAGLRVKHGPAGHIHTQLDGGLAICICDRCAAPRALTLGPQAGFYIQAMASTATLWHCSSPASVKVRPLDLVRHEFPQEQRCSDGAAALAACAVREVFSGTDCFGAVSAVILRAPHCVLARQPAIKLERTLALLCYCSEPQVSSWRPLMLQRPWLYIEITTLHLRAAKALPG